MSSTMPFAALALVALAASPLCGSALRPEVAKSEGLADAGLRATSLVEDLRSAVSSGAATSVAALEQAMTKITSPNDIAWTEDQKTILGQVITVILSMNEELNVSQTSDQKTVDDCNGDLGSMNGELTDRLSDEGSLGELLGTALNSKADLARKVSSHEEKLEDRNLKESSIDSFCAPRAGADQDSWAGFASDYSDKKDALEQWHDSFQAERDAHALLEPARVLRDAHLCDWFGSMTTECSTFEANFQETTESCNAKAVAAQSHTELRNEACKLGKQLSAKVKELLGEADPSGDQAPGKEEDCFELVVPTAPARAECDPDQVMVDNELENDGWTSSQCAATPEPINIDMSGIEPFKLTARIETTQKAGTIAAKAFTESGHPGGLWKSGGGGGQGKILFLRDGKVCFDIGWVGVVCGTTDVNDGAEHEVGVEFASGQYHVLVEGNRENAGLRTVEDHPDLVFMIGDSVGHLNRAGDMAPRFQGKITDVRYNGMAVEP